MKVNSDKKIRTKNSSFLNNINNKTNGNQKTTVFLVQHQLIIIVKII